MNGLKHTDIGREGEDQAARYLRQKGYRIRVRNYRYRRAEIDIIASRGDRLVIVEVKTRSGGFYEALTDSVSRTKINRLVRAADHYVRAEGLELEIRFDIMQVIRTGAAYRVVHHKDAFYFFP